MPAARLPGRARGFILASVLWALALLALAAAGAAATAVSEARITAQMVAAARAQAAAEGGVHFALFALAGSAGRWAADGSVHELDVDGVAVRFSMSDESGRIDLNHAPEAALERLLAGAGAPQGAAQGLAQAIAAARKEAPYESVQDLAATAGISPALHRAVKDSLTVHGRQPGILAEAASRQVLLAAPGTDASDVERYLALRAASRVRGDPPPEPPRSAPAAFTRFGNATFRVHAQARLPAAAAHAAAVVDLRRPRRLMPFLVLDWRREGPELFVERAPR